MKPCRICQEPKPLSDFRFIYINSKKESIYRKDCYQCELNINKHRQAAKRKELKKKVVKKEFKVKIK